MTGIPDSRLRWLGPVGLFLFGHVFFRLRFWLEASPRAIAYSTLVGLGAGLVFWQVSRWIVLRLQRRLPGLERTPQRLLLLVLLLPVLVNAAVFSRYGLHLLLGSRPAWWLGLADYAASFGIQLFYHLVYFGVYEGWYVVHEWKQAYQEKEQLEKLQWQTRFDSLKSQVNPHFLFNALNSLSALIEEAPGQAERFIEELSGMYRHLLRANESELIELGAELKFIQSYAYLLQTRHGPGVQVQIEVADQYLNWVLPPMTLQLLVENAVKHNVVLAEEPLRISISTTDRGQLRVSNNLQRKKGRVLSNGVGLSNIVSKYRMLTPADVVVQEQDGSFTVMLPLLNPVPARSVPVDQRVHS